MVTAEAIANEKTEDTKVHTMAEGNGETVLQEAIAIVKAFKENFEEQSKDMAMMLVAMLSELTMEWTEEFIADRGGDTYA